MDVFLAKRISSGNIKTNLKAKGNWQSSLDAATRPPQTIPMLNRFPWRSTLLCLAAAWTIYLPAADQPLRIMVGAGDYDRHETIVAFKLPATADSALELRDSSGTTIPLQTDKQGNATFILPHLARGKFRDFEVKKTAAGKNNTGVSVKRDGPVLKFSAGAAKLLNYQMEPSQVPAPNIPAHFRHGAHLGPVFSPSGRLVTGDYAPDHRWHRGIWLAWTDTDFEGGHPDFWNMGKEKDGRLTGEVRFASLDDFWSGPVQGGFRSTHRFIDHTSGVEKDVLKETWWVTAYQPIQGKTALNVFDLVSTQVCAGRSPLKLPKYHYGGLGVRGNALWDPVDQVTFLTSEGKDRTSGDSSTGRWVHMGGTVDGGLTGIAILIHPDNFRAPQPLRLNPKNPQLCIAPSQQGDWEISPGKPYVSRHRFVVADGAADAAELDRLWNDYAHPPAVTVELK